MFQCEAMFDKYGIWDYTVFIEGKHFKQYRGWYRFRCYHDGGWLEGYDLEPVVYWGA